MTERKIHTMKRWVCWLRGHRWSEPYKAYRLPDGRAMRRICTRCGLVVLAQKSIQDLEMSTAVQRWWETGVDLPDPPPFGMGLGHSQPPPPPPPLPPERWPTGGTEL
jgi:hypothetical protein